MPSAERAASYHVELVAPPGVRIGQATLLAGRPNEPTAGPPDEDSVSVSSDLTLDHEESSSLTVGLHGAEIPSGSLCRAQVDLRVQSAGWLAVIVSTSWAITAVLAAVAHHYAERDSLGDVQDTNVVVLLVSTAAAAATLVAHREFGGVAARLLVGVRMLAALCTGLPVVAAGFVTFQDAGGAVSSISTGQALRWTTGVAAVLTSLLTLVYALSRLGETGGDRSPWNMTSEQASRNWQRRLRDRIWGQKAPPVDFHAALRRYRFNRPAFGIPSSDAWHEELDATNQSDADAILRLVEAGGESIGGSGGDDHARSAACPRGDTWSCCRHAGSDAAAVYARARHPERLNGAS